MRIVYFGSPATAVRPLQALHDAGHQIALVVTNPPRRRARRSDASPTAVALRAGELGIPVTHDPDDVLDVAADLGVVVAYGRIIGSHLLARLEMVNLHFSLLPRWRGAAPVERAILAGDDRTGVCVMEVAEGLDTGGVYACEEVPITPSTTAQELHAALSELGADLLVRLLSEPLAAPVPQSSEGVTYAEKIHSADLQLDWSRDATELSRVVRVGGAWTTVEGRRLKVLQAEVLPAGAVADLHGADDARRSGADPAGTLVGEQVVCGTGRLRLVRVQPEGRAPMDIQAFLNGARLGADTRLGT